MGLIGRDDLQVFSSVLNSLYAITDLDTFPNIALRLVREMVQGDQISYCELNLPHHFVFVIDPPTAVPPGGWDAVKIQLQESPLFRLEQIGDGRVHKLSDFLTRREVHRLSLYRNVYRLLGTEYQIAVTLPTRSPLLTSITVSRKQTDFSERDRLLLSLLRPHLSRARDTAEWLTLLRQVYENPALVIANLQHKVVLTSGAAREWLDGSEGSDTCELNLPVEIRENVESLLRSIAQNDGNALTWESFVIHQDSRSLSASFLMKGSAANHYAMLFEQPVAALPTVMEGLHLRPRETDVLYWVMKGKSDPEVAALLSLSVRTVEKHLENIYHRLGVHNRGAAIAHALKLTKLSPVLAAPHHEPKAQARVLRPTSSGGFRGFGGD